MNPLPISGLLFSRNRAMQLEATLRSFYRHAGDAEHLDLHVLYRAEDLHQPQYQALQAAFREHPRLYFHAQGDFQADTLALLGQAGGRPASSVWFRGLMGLPRRLGRLVRPLLRLPKNRYILFLVDDNLFVRPFRLADAVSALQAHPKALGFSLRLGRNTTHCYTNNQAQALPVFQPLDEHILSFDWTRAAGDFHYPLEVSSSIYRLADWLPILIGRRFQNPNQFENCVSGRARRFVRQPYLLCYTTSVTFCNPINKVQTEYANRSGEQLDYSNQALAERFAAGQRIDVAAYDGFTPTACHQEVDLLFKT